MDKRLKDIIACLSDYSVGKFDTQLTISCKLDEVDAISTGINMLGEELKAITISRNYFNNIYNAVSDIVLLVNAKGEIVDANKSALIQLSYNDNDIRKKNIKDLLKSGIANYRKALRQINKNLPRQPNQCVIYTKENMAIPISVEVRHFKDERKKQLVLLTASDISLQQKTENLIIRAIINTQEQERQRLAQDIHDGLSQQLAGIKFYIGATAEAISAKKHKAILHKSNDALTEVIADMRNVCFNLMPKTLERFGLVKAVREFCNQFTLQSKAQVLIRHSKNLPAFPPELSIDLYRVIQEFVNNAMKHGHATKVKISITWKNKMLKLVLVDNGVGFETDVARNGMGLQNVQSRVKSHQGHLVISSTLGKGTCYKIQIPVNEK